MTLKTRNMVIFDFIYLTFKSNTDNKMKNIIKDDSVAPTKNNTNFSVLSLIRLSKYSQKITIMNKVFMQSKRLRKS